MQNITIGQYYPGDSVVHRLDSRAKILLCVLFIAGVFWASSLISYGLILLFVLIVIFLAKISPKYMIKGLKPIMYILLLTFVLNLFFATQGNVLFSIGPLHLTDVGLKNAAFMALRLVFLVLGTSLLTLTTAPISLTDGLERLFSPLRVVGFPAHEIAMMMTIALRFIPTLLDETDKIMKAQKARGADFESGNLIARAKAMIPLLVPLFISAFRRADELAMAMEARCYRGGKNRTRLRVMKFQMRDGFAFACTALLCALIILESIF